MSDANWRDIGAGWGDGIINDTGVGAFLLTPSSSSRQLTMLLGEYRIQGRQFLPSQTTMTFTPTAPAAGYVRRDRVIARMDPAAVGADAITFLLREGVAVPSGTSPAGSGLIRADAGVWEMGLWSIAGGNVAADQLDYIDDRVWTHGGTIYHHGNDLLPVPDEHTFGTMLLQNRGTWVERMVRRYTYVGTVATPAWSSMDLPLFYDVNLGTTLKQGVAAPQYGVAGGRVYFRGEVGPRAGGWLTGNGKGLGQVPAEVAPSFNRSFGGFLTNVSDGVRRLGGVTVADTGQLTLDLNVPTGVSVGGVRLDGISYDLGG